MAIAGLRSFRVDTHPWEIDISYCLDRIQIDLKESLGDMGLKGLQRLSREWSHKVTQACNEGIARTARKGDRCRREITSELTALLEAPIRRQTAINVAAVPKQPPVISVTPGWYQLGTTPGSVKVELGCQKTEKHPMGRSIDIYR